MIDRFFDLLYLADQALEWMDLHPASVMAAMAIVVGVFTLAFGVWSYHHPVSP